MSKSAVLFLITAFFLSAWLGIVLANSGRQKKDVHHMIVLSEDGRIPKIYRHKTASYSRDRPKSKRKPTLRPKHRPAVSSEEDDSSEERPMHRTKSKKSQHSKSHKHHKPESHSYPDIPTETYSYSDTKWNPMTSEEFFDKTQPQTMVPVSGSMHFGQPVPIEITTASNFDSTLYPQHHHSMYQAPAFGGIQQPYKPYDYSILEPQPQSTRYVSAGVITSEHYAESGTGTPFSIVVGSSEEEKREQKVRQETSTKTAKKSKVKRGRGSSRFKLSESEAF